MSAAVRAGVLVVGASQAGVQLASSLREFGHGGPVTLVGAEPYPPYQRPPLSKRALREGISPESLVLRSPTYYEDRDIRLALGSRIVRVETGADGSGVAWTGDGGEYAFERLALTVGARARALPIPGSELSGVVRLRDLADAVALRARLETAADVVVVGGGFIGLEVAATAAQMGKRVTVVLADDRLMARAVGTVPSEFFLRAHRERGVEVRLSTRPESFLDDGSGAVRAVVLDDGSVVRTGLVIVGVGATPRTELATQLGLEVADGIMVDEHCVTSDGFTVAAGDCVRCRVPMSAEDGPYRRFESVSTAIEQAKVAAATLAGTQASYRAVPWFWSDQYDLKLQVAGLTDGHDSVVVRGSVVDGAFCALYFRGKRLVAAECVNRPADFMAARGALNHGRTIDAERAGDTTVSLKTLQRDIEADIAEVAV
ncbi:NAD(P)/FAD-dependent oxidoreductase [Nocardia abscessus]|jgi:3-phenylpropionate/trans-cinnamate dioxygenase ferredoxin reductase component|uniref:NAD(P)/FAD-dependent oxidoreductase n=1 Tax=Nocardia TaxID=1817 RepID=UPI001894D982|nr:FAD-dependent oxidoreductase [Nocardia abscessus]MBF6472522.1 FAD-dependent oxidoreductase [Nocardia abscessus]